MEFLFGLILGAVATLVAIKTVEINRQPPTGGVEPGTGGTGYPIDEKTMDESVKDQRR